MNTKGSEENNQSVGESANQILGSEPKIHLPPSDHKTNSVKNDESEDELQMSSINKASFPFSNKTETPNKATTAVSMSGGGAGGPQSMSPSPFLSQNNPTKNSISATSQNAEFVPKFDDVAAILEKIKDPNELPTLFDNYQPRNKEFEVEEVKKSERTKIKKYKDCIFFGEFINAKRHGKGIMLYSNMRIYEGEWENDLKHGKGLEICPNGSRYEGQFVNGKPEGVGTFCWANGEVYEGEWKNGLKHGSGMWRGTKGDSYIGEWKYGKADGYGVHTWRNGDRYEGEFKGFLKHGHGTEKFVNGDFYVGNYVNGKPDGYGEYYWQNGCQYKGFFKNGLRHGKGVWKKGPGKADTYDGEWVNDKKCGTGTYKWVSGNYYQGSYFDDMRHGYGEMYWTDGSYYKGHWEKGIQHGEGELVIPGKKPKRGVFQNNIFIGEAEDKERQNLSHHDEGKGDLSDGGGGKANFSAGGPGNGYKKINTNPLDSSYRQSNNHPRNHDYSYDAGMNYGNNMNSYDPNRSALPEIGGARSRTRSSNRTSSVRQTPLRDRASDSFASQERKRPLQMMNGNNNFGTNITNNRTLLTKRELIKWNHMKEKMGMEARKLKDLSNPDTCQKIRNLINPPIWKPWAKNKVESKFDQYPSSQFVEEDFTHNNNAFPMIK